MPAVKMQLPGAYICITVCILWSLSFSFAIDSTTKSPTTAVRIVAKLANNTSTVNDSHNATNRGPIMNVDISMIQRSLYVLIGITIIAVFYFLIRAVRLKKTTQRKYGLLSNQEDNMEMAHLESDEEDMTVYEAKALRRWLGVANHLEDRVCNSERFEIKCRVFAVYATTLALRVLRKMK